MRHSDQTTNGARPRMPRHDWRGVVRAHPVACTTGALGLGLVAGLALMRKKRLAQPPSSARPGPSELHKHIAGLGEHLHKEVSVATRRVLLPLLLRKFVKWLGSQAGAGSPTPESTTENARGPRARVGA
jgi:hypothetical protein